MDEAARQDLAQQLGEMKIRKAMRTVRNMDRDANMIMWRNAVKDEYHTVFLLPNEGVIVTLVEQNSVSASERKIGGGPQGLKAQNVEFTYVEARVTDLERPAQKRGGSGPSPLKRAELRTDA